MYPECVKLASLRHGDIYAAKHEQLKALAAHQNEKGGRNSLKKKRTKNAQQIHTKEQQLCGKFD